jgi:predicted dehydrogenase
LAWGRSFDLDFHAISFHGEDALVEKQDVSKRSRRQKGALAFLAQDADRREQASSIRARELIREGLLGPVTMVRTGKLNNRPVGQNNWRWHAGYFNFDRPVHAHDGMWQGPGSHTTMALPGGVQGLVVAWLERIDSVRAVSR